MTKTFPFIFTVSMSFPDWGRAKDVPFKLESVRIPEALVNIVGVSPPDSEYGLVIFKVTLGSEPLSEKFIPKSMTGSDRVEAVTVTTYPVVKKLPNVPLMEHTFPSPTMLRV